MNKIKIWLKDQITQIAILIFAFFMTLKFIIENGFINFILSIIVGIVVIYILMCAVEDSTWNRRNLP